MNFEKLASTQIYMAKWTLIYRTAPATPGLLIILLVLFLIVTNGISEIIN